MRSPPVSAFDLPEVRASLMSSAMNENLVLKLQDSVHPLSFIHGVPD